MIPKRRKNPKMGLRDPSVIRCPSHLKWVRGHECACTDKGDWKFTCETRVEAAHVRSSQEGGIGMKPGDNWSIPLCSVHHRHQHMIGEHAFEKLYKIDMKKIAAELWRISPHGQRWRREHNE